MWKEHTRDAELIQKEEKKRFSESVLNDWILENVINAHHHKDTTKNTKQTERENKNCAKKKHYKKERERDWQRKEWAKWRKNRQIHNRNFIDTSCSKREPFISERAF